MVGIWWKITQGPNIGHKNYFNTVMRAIIFEFGQWEVDNQYKMVKGCK